MGDFDDLTITAASEIVSADKISEMTNQAEAWQGLAYLFDSQLARLAAATRSLSDGWGGPAGAAFAAQVGRVQATLTSSRETAIGNAAAWSRVVSEATTVREVIYQIEAEYKTALGNAQDDYAEKKAEADNSWLNNPITSGLVDQPDEVKPDAVRKPFDERARAVFGVASDVYRDSYSALQDPPPYDGPAGATEGVGLPPTGPTSTDDSAGGGTPGLLGGAGLVGGTAVVTWTDVAPSGPILAGSTAPTLPAPTSPGGTLPPAAGPGGLPPGGGGLPTSLFPSAFPVEPAPAPRVPIKRPSLLPEPVEPGQSVIGSRQGPNTGGIRGKAADASVIGSRGGRGASAQTGPRVGRSEVKPSEGKAVIGRETAPAGRGRAGVRTPAAGAGADGVVRPGGRGEQSAGARSGSAGQRGRQRRDEADTQAETTEGTELWDVADGVPAVVEPPATYDATSERPGPHVGRSDGRRR
jgi:hypothetical protein